MNKLHSKFLFGFVCLCYICAASATELSVNISNIKEHKGEVVVQLFHLNDEKLIDTKLSDPISLKAPVHQSDNVTVQFPELPVGLYAVVAFHDVNKNGKADFSVFGSRERVVISNLSSQPLSAPTYSEAAFKVGDEDFTISFALYD